MNIAYVQGSTPRLATVCLNRFPHACHLDVEGARESVEEVKRLFERFGLVAEDWSEPGTKDDLEQRLQHLFGPAADPESPLESLVLYWTGHGFMTKLGATEKFHLATNPEEWSATGRNPKVSDDWWIQLLVTEQVNRLAAHPDTWRLVIIDSCESGPGIELIRRGFSTSGLPDNLVLVGTSPRGAAYSGTFAATLASVLHFPQQTQPIPLKEIRSRLAAHIGDNQVTGQFHSTAVLSPPEDMLEGIAATVADRKELETVLRDLPVEARTHLIPKAQGGELKDAAWHFQGRKLDRTRVANWLNHAEQGMYVVTGEAGAGKSALLGMTYASTITSLMNTLERMGHAFADPLLRPHEGVAFDAALHLSGQDVGGVMASLATALGVELPADRSLDKFVDRVRRVASGRRLTILADALDESQDPFIIAASVLRRLAQTPNIRVLVGTRESLGEDPDHPGQTNRLLLPSLSPGASDVLRLQRDQEAVFNYVRSRLEATLGDRTAVEVAAQVAEHDQPFLFARLAVHEVLADPSRTDHELLQRLLCAGHRGIFGRAVERLGAARPATGSLLWALAYARGRGFPRNDGIWATAGSALHGGQLTDRDVSIAEEEAAPYIMVDAEFGQAAYRLAHRTFVEYYHDRDTPTPTRASVPPAAN